MDIKRIVLICFGIYLAALLTAKVFFLETLQTQLQIVATTGASTPNYWYLIYIVASLLIFTIVAIKFGKKRSIISKVLMAYYFIFILVATFILVTIYTSSLTGWIGWAVGILSMAVVGYLYLFKRIEFFNYFGVIIAISAPILLAFDLNLWTVIALLIFLSIYDFIAVFITKHMLVLAQLSLGDSPIPTMMVFGNFKDIQDNMNSNNVVCKLCRNFMKKESKTHFICENCGREVKIIGKTKKVIKNGDINAPKKPKVTYALGLGDLILPSIFPIAIMLKFGIFPAFIAVIGATIGVGLNLYIVKKRSIGLPALPLIVSSMMIATLVVVYLVK